MLGTHLSIPVLVLAFLIFGKDSLALIDLDPPWIEIAGCRKNSDTAGLRPIPIANNSPSDCFSLCPNVTHIALQGENCSCVPNTVLPRFNDTAPYNCDEVCKGNPAVRCGRVGSPYMSLYSRVPWNRTEYGCVVNDTTDSTGYKYHVYSCDKDANRLCRDIFRNGPCMKYLQSNWSFAVTACVLYTYSNPWDNACIANAIPIYWVGIFRRETKNAFPTTVISTSMSTFTGTDLSTSLTPDLTSEPSTMSIRKTSETTTTTQKSSSSTILYGSGPPKTAIIVPCVVVPVAGLGVGLAIWQKESGGKVSEQPSPQQNNQAEQTPATDVHVQAEES